MTKTNSLLLLCCALTLGHDAVAQLVDVSGCRALANHVERLQCYDTLGVADAAAPAPAQSTAAPPPQVAAPVAAPPPANTAIAVAPPAPAASGNTNGDQGFGRQTARVVETEDGKELLDTVAALELVAPSTWLVTLAGGQQWRQRESKRYALQEGDEIRIYSSRWGNGYRLTAPRLSGFIQVARVD